MGSDAQACNNNREINPSRPDQPGCGKLASFFHPARTHTIGFEAQFSHPPNRLASFFHVSRSAKVQMGNGPCWRRLPLLFDTSVLEQ
jgi:hypothetical protein